MNMNYSASTNRFYDLDSSSETIPDDVIAITNEKYQQLLDDITKGNTLGYDNDGYPIVIGVYYSPSTNGFYDPSLNYSSKPDDLKPITHARHSELLAGVANGYKIQPDVNGLPELIAPSQDELDQSAARAAQSKRDVAKYEIDVKSIAVIRDCLLKYLPREGLDELIVLRDEYDAIG